MVTTQKHQPVIFRLYDYLKGHIGEENAIKGKDLSNAFGISERTLRTYIKEIRRSAILEKYVQSSAKGYYLVTKDDYRSGRTSREMWALSVLKTEADQRRKVAKDGQGKIPCGDYYKEYFEAFVGNVSDIREN